MPYLHSISLATIVKSFYWPFLILNNSKSNNNNNDNNNNINNNDNNNNINNNNINNINIIIITGSNKLITTKGTK